MFKIIFSAISKKIDGIIFSINTIFLSFIPIILILGGGFVILGVPLGWFFEKNIVTRHLWYVFFAIIAVHMGFRWDQAVIEHYSTAIKIKKNYTKSNEKN